MALDVSTFIDINATIATGGVPRLAFGRGLVLTIDDTLSAGGSNKVQLYNSLNAVVDAGFGADAQEAATTWFSQDPQPQGLYAGRWANVDVSSSLTGRTPVAANLFTAANYSFAINGSNVTPIDLTTPTTYTAIAAVIQTALSAVITGATVAYNASPSGFTITLPGSTEIDPPYLETAMVSGSPVGTDLVPLMSMAQSDSPTYVQGHDAETAVEAATEIVGLTASPPVAIMLADDAPLVASSVDTRETLAAWASAGDYMFGLRDTSAQALVTGDTTSPSALAFGREQGKVLAAFDNAGGQPEISGLAILSSQNLNNAATITTLHNKAAPGVSPSTISLTQYEELKRKRVNVVTAVGSVNRMVGGYTSRSGYWADAQWWVLWMTNELELAIFNAQSSSRRMTTGIMTDAITGAAQTGIRNGGIMPGGQVSSQTKADIINTTNNNDFNGTMTTGYILWVERFSVRTQVDRENRIGRFKLWVAPSEAIHEVMGDLIFG